MKLTLFFILVLSSFQTAFADYRSKHFCQTEEALQRLSERIIIERGRFRLAYEKTPLPGDPGALEYMKNKKCFFHDVYPWSYTEISNLVIVDTIFIADSSDGSPWKVEFYGADFDFKSRVSQEFAMSFPCRPDEDCRRTLWSDN